MKTFKVEVTYTQYCSAEIEVEADNEEHAEEIAQERWDDGAIEVESRDGQVEFNVYTAKGA